MTRTRDPSGQAAVEFAVVAPLAVAVLAVVVQVVLVVHAAWAVRQAASAAARAAAVGADAGLAARRALPSDLERGLRVRETGDGEVTVRVRAPRLVGSLDLGTLSATGRHAAQS